MPARREKFSYSQNVEPSVDGELPPIESDAMDTSRTLHCLAFVFLTSSALTVTGCDLIKKLKGDKDQGDTTTSGEGPTGKPTAGCELPDTVKADVTVKKGCAVVLKHNVEVREGATLRIEPGVKISVEQNSYIWVVDGKLVAKGTEKEPILLTSANKTTAPGDWVGIVLEDKTQAGTELDWVRIEYAGGASGGGKGAITILDQSSPKRISITNVTIVSSGQAAVVNEGEKGGFAKFEKNTFKKNKSSLEGHARVLGTVGAGNVFSDTLVAAGDVKESTTWPAFDAPVQVKDHFEIGGEKTPATLTIAPKTILKMNGGAYITIGELNGGSLVANGVTFTSANGTPHPGDWVGLIVYERASTVQLDGAVIEYAGAEASTGKAAITFYNIDAKKVRGAKLTNVTFRHNANAAMYSPDHDCSPFAANKSEGAPLCRPAD